jgi:hypothetical protein
MTTPADKLQQIALLRQKIQLAEGLPHLWGMSWYQWAWDFFQSTNRYNFLCAANQISKSSTQIRKCIDWATDVGKWPSLWRKRPLQFWYLYPTREVATIEFEKKWVEEWLPKGSYKDHPQYGWRGEYKNKYIWAIHFNTGVTVYFKTYATDAQHLQSGSVDAIFADEELPFALYPELNMRISATWGHFHMVFTATIGQVEWEETIEHIGSSRERFQGAFKRQVSMYDCLKYMDGSPSHWTEEKIEIIKKSCATNAEILRRVHGKFVKDSGLKYPSFDRVKNVKTPHPLPQSWPVFAGIDTGSGGGEGHPAAICFVAVSPDFKKGRIFRGWRGDHEQTTASDVLQKYLELKKGLNVVAAYYDWSDKDFGMIAQRSGVPVMPADKSHERGEKILNVLFKNQILMVYDIPELHPLVHEFCTLSRDTHKTKAKDDFVDATRYAVVSIGWDYSILEEALGVEAKSKMSQEEIARRGDLNKEQERLDLGVDAELAFWGELYES